MDRHCGSDPGSVSHANYTRAVSDGERVPYDAEAFRLLQERILAAGIPRQLMPAL